MKCKLEIHNFKYNGFFAEQKKGMAGYKGRFLVWTTDPGVAKIECSDGFTRFIPSCFIKGLLPPEPNYTEMKKKGTFQYFGIPSKS